MGTLLLKERAIPTVPHFASGETIPQLAARNGDVESLRLLYEAGLDLSARQYSSRSALLEAVDAEALDCVEYLLARGLDPAGMTGKLWQYHGAPLWRAAEKASLPMLQALVRAGVERDVLEGMARQTRGWAQSCSDEQDRQRMGRTAQFLEEAAKMAAAIPVSRSGH